MLRAPSRCASRARATGRSRSTAAKAACEPACLMVVPSAHTTASTGVPPKACSACAKSVTGLTSLGCAASARRVGATTCCTCGCCSAKRSTSLPTAPVAPSSKSRTPGVGARWSVEGVMADCGWAYIPHNTGDKTMEQPSSLQAVPHCRCAEVCAHILATAHPCARFPPTHHET